MARVRERISRVSIQSTSKDFETIRIVLGMWTPQLCFYISYTPAVLTTPLQGLYPRGFAAWNSGWITDTCWTHSWSSHWKINSDLYKCRHDNRNILVIADENGALENQMNNKMYAPRTYKPFHSVPFSMSKGLSSVEYHHSPLLTVT